MACVWRWRGDRHRAPAAPLQPVAIDVRGKSVHNHIMRQILPKLHIPVSSWMIFPVACALVVIGAKIWMIAQYGSPTPFWDQWDAEGAILYPKYFDGTLSFSDLIAPHSEHRILITRLWLLLLLELGGYWNPTLQMLANTAILGAFVALLITAFRPHPGRCVLDRVRAVLYRDLCAALRLGEYARGLSIAVVFRAVVQHCRPARNH